MVFHQNAADEVFVHNGTVHAPDIEMALLNARDVFSRRRQSVAMWVVPAQSIYSATLEEVESMEHVPMEESQGERKSYYVFAKLSQQGYCEQVGTVNAGSQKTALQAALRTFPSKKALWWWVFPVEAVLASKEEDAASMYSLSRKFEYKNQAAYPVITMMRQIYTKGKLSD